MVLRVRRLGVTYIYIYIVEMELVEGKRRKGTWIQCSRREMIAVQSIKFGPFD
jgi:hypothetical protein